MNTEWIKYIYLPLERICIHAPNPASANRELPTRSCQYTHTRPASITGMRLNLAHVSGSQQACMCTGRLVAGSTADCHWESSAAWHQHCPWLGACPPSISTSQHIWTQQSHLGVRTQQIRRKRWNFAADYLDPNNIPHQLWNNKHIKDKSACIVLF